MIQTDIVEEAAPSSVRREILRPSGQLDTVLYRDPEDGDSVFDMPLAIQDRYRRRLVADAFHHHVGRCPPYARYVAATGAPSQLPDDWRFEQIPVVPTGAFKRSPPLSVAEEMVERWTLSSGTQGVQSRVPRDRPTLERLLGSVRTGLGLIDTWYEDEVEVLNLGPERSQAGKIWFPFVMSLVELLHPTRHQVVDGRFDPARTIRDLQSALDRVPHVGIVGPPALLLDLLDWMRRSDSKVDGGRRLHLVTAGGWKRYSGRTVSRADLAAMAAAAFGLADESQLRDAFNQVELNTVLMECSARRKHVPCWVHASARDPVTLLPLPPGTRGLLSYLDASAESYPAFVVGDDVGTVEVGACSCGREAVTISVERRVEGRAQRGCALTMDNAYGSETDRAF